MKTLAAILCLVCAAAAAWPARAQGDGGVIRVANNPAGTAAFAVYAMKKYHLDEKYGFKFQEVPTAGSQAASLALQSGSAEIIVTDFITTSLMRNAGIRVIDIAPMFKWGDQIVVPVDSPIHTLADLRGKKIGTDGVNKPTWLVIVAAGLKSFGLNLNRDATVQVGGVSLLRGLMEQGQLDASFMYNNVSPDMVASGKFRVLYQMRDLIEALGLDGDVPFLFEAVSEDYAARHPANVRAYLAAYRESVDILRTNDELWVEIGHSMKMNDAAIVPLRDEMRRDLSTRFDPGTEKDVRSMFDVLLATAGTEALGLGQLSDSFMTTQYQ